MVRGLQPVPEGGLEMKTKSPVLILALILALYWVVVVGYVFNQSLPNWCANHDGNGNWIVQPICK